MAVSKLKREFILTRTQFPVCNGGPHEGGYEARQAKTKGLKNRDVAKG